MSRRLWAIALICACASRSGPPDPPADPHATAAEVVDGLLVAAEPATAEPLEAWRAAHAAFEAHLEEPLRERHGDRAVTEVEYGFGLVRAQLGTARSGETARRVGERIASLCADLPKAGA